LESDLTLQPPSEEKKDELEQISDQEVSLVEGEGDLPGAVVDDGGNFVKMFLSAAGVQFKLHTRVDQSREATELAAQLELALTLLQANQSRLEQAFIRIGQLESQLEAVRQTKQTKSQEASDLC